MNVNVDVILNETQKKALEKANEKDSFAFFMPTGTGKTLTTLLCCLNKNIENILVIGPVSSKETWQKEAKIGYTLIDLNQKVLVETEKALYWINYDNISKIYYPPFNKLLAKFKNSNSAIILDESHYIKNPKAKRTKICILLRKYFKHAFLLSATPAEKYEELYSQFYFLIPDEIRRHYESYYDFKEKHLIVETKTTPSGKSYEVVKGYRNIAQFLDIIKEYYFATTKKIKKEEYKWIEIPSLNQPIEDLIEKYKNFTHAHIAASGYCPIEKRWINTDKIKQVSKIVKENPNEHIVIFANFLHETEVLAKVLNADIMTGETTKSITNWNKNVLVCSYALAESIDLSRANKMIFFSYPLAWKKFYQAKGRINRISQKKEEVQYYFIYSEAEKHIIKMLVKKKDVNTNVLMKNIRKKDL